MKKSLGARALLMPTPVLLVGTYDESGRPNAMTVAWGGVVCSNPPSLSVSLRMNRYTYENLLKRKAFTVSILSEKYVAEADYFGMVSGRKVDKFHRTGLTPIRSEVVDAPYVKESPLVLECALTKTVEIGVHTQIIGEILDVKADEEVLNEEGLPDASKVMPMIYIPECGLYYGFGKVIDKAYSAGKKYLD
ncbi:MAG: flavin reductase family protein [Candidatus Aminicenantes bacterium]|nr:flavin reductase family protein [Candidatus Aminicenantes bacterium]